MDVVGGFAVFELAVGLVVGFVVGVAAGVGLFVIAGAEVARREDSDC